MDVFVLNAGVSINSIYTNLTQEQMKAVEQYSQDGFTEDELQKMESQGIDTSKIKANATLKGADAGKKSVADAVKEIKAKYCNNLGNPGADPYKSDNPQLTALNKALDDGLMEQLGDAGYSKQEIVEIIQGAFPSIGIKSSGNGKYECPNGHDAKAVEIYNKFVTQLLQTTSPEAAELRETQKKIKQLNAQIDTNNAKIQDFDNKILMLQADIEEKIKAAISEIESITEEQKNEANSAVNKRLNEYISAKGTMSYEDFQKNLESDLSGLASDAGSEISAEVLKIAGAQKDMQTLNGYLTSMKSLIDENASLSNEVKSLNSKVSELQEKIKKIGSGTDGDGNRTGNCDKDCQKTDPIGFENGNIRYDFFVDKDNNEDLSNKQEFLGSDNGFKELINMDGNKDKKIDASELDKNNVKVVVTKADGRQEIKSASEVFGKNDSIDLSSYNSTNKDIGNGNQLIGTFNLSMGGNKIEGYQTLDSNEWLDKNYNFTDGAAGTADINDRDAINRTYSQRFSFYAQNFSALTNQGQAAMNVSARKINESKNIITNDAAHKGETSAEHTKQQYEKEELEAQEADKAKKAEEAAKKQEIEDKKKLEEEEI